ncbi:MAG: hypothetical protein WBF13_07350 [Candidatus Zixiibacteriota bacterium]
MKRLHKKVGAIYAVQLTLLLTCVLPAKALPLTDHVQTYVSKSRLENLQLEKSSGFSLTQILVQDSSKAETSDSVQIREVNTTKAKEPYKAFLYALVPGAVLHGAGHFYAGKTGTGFVLLGSELSGATLILVSVGMSWEH